MRSLSNFCIYSDQTIFINLQIVTPSKIEENLQPIYRVDFETGQQTYGGLGKEELQTFSRFLKFIFSSTQTSQSVQ